MEFFNTDTTYAFMLVNHTTAVLHEVTVITFPV